jgi:hypothetical protein
MSLTLVLEASDFSVVEGGARILTTFRRAISCGFYS